MSEGENVKVAVRVRPFNRRERERNAKLIVEMSGPTTILTDPEDPNEEPRKFAFDHSYWSFDGCKEEKNGYFAPDPSHPNGKKFCDQKRVFEDLGIGVLNNAWEGFNSTLFAYGQTGSGKSWSVVGYGPNKGIVPMFAEKLFQQVDAKKGPELRFEVAFSMLEIYMEEVRDLLDSGPKRKGGLRIRQHPRKGFYVDSLTKTAVDSYQEIEKRMEEGTTNRTVASTNMNATSSRAHTIVGLVFSQISKNAAGEETAKTSVVNLVDLAGSERADSTGATGDRLKEGAAINQSLSSLGNVIAALAEQSEGKRVRVPYRDSVLTKLLMNALGGNSKTVMIAAISPADINFEESLSTLRYADRAKQIKCKAVVNEDPTEKLIRELQEENEKLKLMMAGKGGAVQLSADDEELTDSEKAAIKKEMEEDLAAAMEENQKQIEEMKKDYEQKLAEARSKGNFEEVSAHLEMAKTVAHISNLNFDPQLCGHIVHFVDLEKETVGNRRGTQSDIPLIGPSIAEEHAVFTREDGKYYLNLLDPKARTLVNGLPLTEKTLLHHNDRLIFGTTQYFIFIDPKERDTSKQTYKAYTFEEAEQEVAQQAGFDMNTDNKSGADIELQGAISDLLPAVEEANAISADLDMKRMFEIVIVSPESRGEAAGKRKPYVQVHDLETDLKVLWSAEVFLGKRFTMRQMFNSHEDEEDWKLPKDQDPFYIDYDKEALIGSVKLYLQNLAYKVEMKGHLQVVSYHGKEVGLLFYELVPCDEKGKEYTEADDVFVDNPKDLVGKPVHFVVKTNSSKGLPKIYKDIYCSFSLMETVATSPAKPGPDPEWKFKKQFDFSSADDKLVSFLETGAVMVQLWGKMVPPKDKKQINTKQYMEKVQMAKKQTGGMGDSVDPNKDKDAAAANVLKMRAQKAETKIENVKRLIAKAEQGQAVRIPVSVLKELMNSPNTEADKILKWQPKGADLVLHDDDDRPKSASSKSSASSRASSAKKSRPKSPKESDNASCACHLL